MSASFWTVYLDIYGFTDRVTGGEMDAVSEALSEVYDGAARDLEGNGIHHYFLSDSVILVCPDDGYTSINRFLTATKLILRHAAVRELIFRGAVAHGPMKIKKNVCVGQPLIRAYHLEQAIGCPIVVLPEREFLRSRYEPLPRFSLIPTKDGGEISAIPIFPAPLDELIEHCGRMVQRAQVDGPSAIVRPWKLLLELALEKQDSGDNDE